MLVMGMPGRWKLQILSHYWESFCKQSSLRIRVAELNVKGTYWTDTIPSPLWALVTNPFRWFFSIIGYFPHKHELINTHLNTRGGLWRSLEFSLESALSFLVICLTNSVVKTALPMQGARVRSLVKELRSHMLCGVAKEPQKTKNLTRPYLPQSPISSFQGDFWTIPGCLLSMLKLGNFLQAVNCQS